jgi:hypothetical protein
MSQGESKRKTRAEARQAFSDEALKMWDEFNAWSEAHPEATWKDYERQLTPRRRVLMGRMMELFLSQGELGAKAEGLTCETCGRPMVFKGYPGKELHSLEGDSRLNRAYYYCPHCKAGLFPPGSTPEPEAGPVE